MPPLAYADLGYGVIDADQHWDGIDVPRDLYRKRVVSKFKDRAPQWITVGDDGDEAISYNGGEKITKLAPKGDPTMQGLRKLSGHTVADRLHEMDVDGIHAAVLFSLEIPINDAYAADRDVAIALIQAYNDYKVEEVSAPSGNRLFTLGILPHTGVKDTVSEMERCLSTGHKGVMLMQWPAGPNASPDDDYFWAAAQDLHVPVCIHAINAFGGSESIARSLHALRVAERFPQLEIGLIEMGIGWIPYFLQQSDFAWLTYRFSEGFKAWVASQGMEGALSMGSDTMAPSESFHRLFHSSFLFDPLGVELRHHIGIDKIMWSTDFPHGNTSWPKSRVEFDHLFAGVPRDEVKLMVHDNARNFFHLTEVP
jgi:predicted TIM-barrel fold metal-dependent hydrolase